MIPRRPIGKRDVMPWPESEVLHPLVERARGHERSLETAWCADYGQGERLGRRWGGGAKRDK